MKAFPLAALVVGALLGPQASRAADPRLSAVDDVVYVLQPDGSASLSAITASRFDLAIVDYSSDGTAIGEHSASSVAALRNSGKIALAYLSIGEAESYRYYWNPSWNSSPPAWLGPENPDFQGNFKVRYWQPAWRSILFGTPAGPNRSYLDRILDQGFDGVYLDIIDGFTFWSEERGERSRFEARRDMVALVQAIARYARVTRGRRNFLVFPQNGEDLILDDEGELDELGRRYLRTLSGLGVEDVFYDELTPQDDEAVEFRTTLLQRYVQAGKLILATDYVWDSSAPHSSANKARYNDFKRRARAERYVPYAAIRDRGLDEIVRVRRANGFEVAQPQPHNATTAALP